MTYILQSAAKNIRRYAGRYLLFGALVLVALAVGTVALMAGTELDVALDDLMNRYGGTVLVYRGAAYPTPEEFAAIEALDEVERVDYTRFYFEVFQAAISIDGQRIRTDELHQDMQNRGVIKGYNRDKRQFASYTSNTSNPYMGVIGIDFACDPTVNYDNRDTYFYEGRYPENDHECALNQTYLDWIGFRDVKLGSTLTLTLGESVREYTVVGLQGGIYQYSTRMTDEETGTYSPLRVKPWQCPILLTYDAAEGLRQDGTLERYYLGERMRVGVKLIPSADGEGKYAESGIALSNQSLHNAQIILKSHTLYDSFRASMEQLRAETGRGYQVEMAYAGADELLEAYRASGRITDIALAAVLLLAAAVVLIMTALSMHERRYEIGVLLAVGMGKGRIAALFAAESILFTVGVAALAFAAGAVLAPDAAVFLTEQIAVTRAAAVPVAATMLALALGLSLIASSLSSLAILRYRPMTILRSRS